MTEDNFKKFRNICLAVLGVFIFSGCMSYMQDMASGSKWRYKLTVTVETPEGLKTGSAVREVRVLNGIKLLPEMSPSIDFIGEAVVIDLGKRGLLFLLTHGDYAKTIVFDVFPFDEPLTAKGIKHYSKLKNAKATLTTGQYPYFARFRDINNPVTIENVRFPADMESFQEKHPGIPVVSFEEAFGAGVAIKSVVLETTDEPVTFGIEKYLPWLKTIGGKNLGGGNHSGSKWYENLGMYEFKKETF